MLNRNLRSNLKQIKSQNKQSKGKIRKEEIKLLLRRTQRGYIIESPPLIPVSSGKNNFTASGQKTKKIIQSRLTQINEEQPKRIIPILEKLKKKCRTIISSQQIKQQNVKEEEDTNSQMQELIEEKQEANPEILLLLDQAFDQKINNIEVEIKKQKQKQQAFSVPMQGEGEFNNKLLPEFNLNQVSETEIQAVPEFFSSTKSSKTKDVYLKYRNYMIQLYQANPKRYLSVTTCRRNLAGDANGIMRIHKFLEQLNYNSL